jgi:hypothetical protein
MPYWIHADADMKNPVPDLKAADTVNLGRVVDLKVEDGKLIGICQFIGDPKEAALIASRMESSVRTITNFTDDDGEELGEILSHVAVVPAGRIGRLQSFQPFNVDSVPGLAASRCQASEVFSLTLAADNTGAKPMACTDEECEAIKGHMRDNGAASMAEQVKPENGTAMLLAHAKDMAKKVKDSGMRLSQETEALTATKAELATAKKARDDTALELSQTAKRPTAITDREAAAWGRTLKGQGDMALAAGGIDKATREAIDAILCPGGKPGELALSMSQGSVDPFGAALYDILRNNKPLTMEQRSRIDPMAASRSVPGDVPKHDPNKKSPLEETAESMYPRAAAK